MPARGPRSVDQIQPMEIMVLLEGIDERGAGELTTRVLHRVRAVFSWAVWLSGTETSIRADELRDHPRPRKEEQQTAS